MNSKMFKSKKLYYIILFLIFIVSVSVFIQWDIVWYYIKLKQRELNKFILLSIRSLKENYSLAVFAKFIFGSFIYGFFHALGPGHGKSVIAIHLLNEKKKWRSALYTSFISSITHVGGAVIISLSLFYIFTELGLFERQSLNRYVTAFGSVALLLIGGILLISFYLGKSIFGKFSSSANNNTLIGVVAGMIPCPVTMSVLLVSLSYSIFYIGIASAVGIAFGLFVALCCTSLLPMYITKSAVIIGGDNKALAWLRKSLPLFQAVFMILIGVVLFPF